jgi:beta-lactamase regulating signal transducer with metallopeptidase domain
LQKRVRAGMRYCLWMLVLLKLLLPPTLCLPTGVGYWIGDYMSADSPVLHQFSEAVQLRSVSRTSPEDFTATPETLHVRPPKPFAETLAPVASAASRVTTPTWQAVVFLVWLVGVLVISALLIQRIRFVRVLLCVGSSSRPS